MAATHTTYYNLNKPDRQDFVSVVSDINDNMDSIDSALYGLDTNKVGVSDKGVANGIASLDAYGKVPSAQLPSYVDDVIEGYLYNGSFYKESSHTTVITPESDKIYVDVPTSRSYRWSGSLYVRIDNPEEIIDDNAGFGDTDKTYSADKIVKIAQGKADVIEDSITTPASVQTFPDGADNLPMALKVAVEPVQEGTGDPSPTNIRPITGHTGANVTVANGDDSTAQDYEATVYQISFPSSAGTVYGATLSINKDGSGELVVDKISVAGNELTWSLNPNGYFGTATSGSSEKMTGKTNLISDTYKNVNSSASSMNNGEMTGSNSNGNIYIRDDSYATDTAFNADAGNFHIVYKLATPVTYQLTPGQVKTLLGTNNLWSDVGDIKEVTAPRDTKLYIDRKFAELSAAITALGT